MDFGGKFVVETAFGQSVGDSLPVLMRQTKGGIVMTIEDKRAIQDALRYLLSYFSEKVRFEIYNPARCETKERCLEVCNELIRLIDLLEWEEIR